MTTTFPGTSHVLPLWPDDAPGHEEPGDYEEECVLPGGLRVVRNVTRPTLTAYLPDPAVANGTAVIVCPGGAYHFLAFEHEGIEVARWLNGHGVAAFMLKYRLLRTGDDFPGHLRGAYGHHDGPQHRDPRVDCVHVFTPSH